MIEARGLTKRYGDTLAVDDLSFRVEPGKITGFLGPNGAGKTTTMRLILGLDHPTSGTVTVNDRPFDRLAHPMREVGALLDAKAVHGGRSAYNHLLCLAEDQPHRSGLARSVRAEEAGDLPGLHPEREVVDGERVTVPFGEPPCLDHVFPFLPVGQNPDVPGRLPQSGGTAFGGASAEGLIRVRRKSDFRPVLPRPGVGLAG